MFRTQSTSGPSAQHKQAVLDHIRAGFDAMAEKATFAALEQASDPGSGIDLSRFLTPHETAKNAAFSSMNEVMGVAQSTLDGIIVTHDNFMDVRARFSRTTAESFESCVRTATEAALSALQGSI